MLNGSVPPLGETLILTRPEGSDGKTIGRIASEWQINSLPGRFCVKIIWQQISLPNGLTDQSTTPSDKRRKRSLPPPRKRPRKNRVAHNRLKKSSTTRAEHSRLTSAPPLIMGLGDLKDSPVSDTKLTLDLRVWLISSHSAADKLF